MHFKLPFLTTLFLLISWFGISQTSFPVDWIMVRNIDFVNQTITKTASSNGVGLAQSKQVLFGEGQSNVLTGSFSYTTNNTVDLKKIGYSPINNPDVNPGQIVYGFSFGKNGKLNAYSPLGQVSQSYTSTTKIKLEKNGQTLNYLIDGVQVYSVVINSTENLVIRAKLRSENSSFANVSSDYNTTPFCVLPIIDNVNKTIDLQVTGAFPPYRYIWEGVNAPSRFMTTFVEGQNFVTIFDSQANKVRRMFSIGSDLNWTNLYLSDYSNKTLSALTTAGKKWASAEIGTNFAPTSTSWVEYIIEKQAGGQKAFGFADASRTIRRTKHLKTGFLISNRNLQIIDSGRVVLAMDYLDKDALNLQYLNGEVVWFVNGEVIHSSTFVQNGDVKIAGLVKKSGTLKNVNYSTNQPALLNSSWDDISETGQIDVDISSIAGVVGPFHYMISEQPIPHLNETYSFLKDSIAIPVDSISFYTGNEVATTKSFTGLASGTYYVSVFDSQGNRLFERSKTIQAAFTFDNQTNLVASGTRVKAIGGDGVGSLELYVDQRQNSELTIELSRVKKEQFYGYSVSDNIQSYADITYGFYLLNRRLYTVENGVLSTSFVLIRRNEKLSLSIDNNTLLLKTSNMTLKTISLGTTYQYKVGLGIKKGGNTTITAKGLWGKKYHIYSTIQQHLMCDNTAPFNLTFNVFRYFQIVQQSYTYSIFDENNNLIYSATGVTGTLQTINEAILGFPLTAGVYTVSGNIAPGSATFSGTFCLGYQVEWEDVVDYDLIPNTFSLLRTIPETSNYSAARSDNVLLPNQTGWMEYTPRTTGPTSGFFPTNPNFVRLTGLNPFSSIPLTNEAFIYFGEMSSGMVMMYTYVAGNGIVNFINSNARIKAKITLGQLEVYVNGSLISSLPISVLSHLFRAGSLSQNNGFQNVITSFSCPKQGVDFIGYSELKKKLDGGYAHGVEGQVKMTFDEEYEVNSGKFVSMKIFNGSSQLMEQINFDGTSINGTPSTIYDFDDNRITLNISSIPGMTIDEYYVVEVSTIKEEKLYLRFLYKN